MNSETDRVSDGQKKIYTIGIFCRSRRFWICFAVTFLVLMSGHEFCRRDMILTENDFSELLVGDVHLTVPKRYYFMADIRPNYGVVHMPDDISFRSRGSLHDVWIVDPNLESISANASGSLDAPRLGLLFKRATPDEIRQSKEKACGAIELSHDGDEVQRQESRDTIQIGNYILADFPWLREGKGAFFETHLKSISKIVSAEKLYKIEIPVSNTVLLDIRLKEEELSPDRRLNVLNGLSEDLYQMLWNRASFSCTSE